MRAVATHTQKQVLVVGAGASGLSCVRHLLRQGCAVRLLTPFDPIVHDRRRFEVFWGWRYRFEAYTPAARRKLGYYALPLLWHDQVVGWGNLSVDHDTLRSSFGYSAGAAPRDTAFRAGLAAELERMRQFLGLGLGLGLGR